VRLELGQFDEGIWRELTAEYNIATSEQEHAEKEASLSELLDKHSRDHEYIMQRFILVHNID
jgi:hypothetical protein